MCKFSIISSVYNTELYLEKCIKSVLNQTFSDFEFILINNGSSDNSDEILKKYELLDSRIKVIRNDSNRYLAEARNQGIDIAEGEYIYFIDSDDYLDVQFLENAINELGSYDYDLIIFGWIMEYFVENEFISIPVIPSAVTFINQENFRYSIMDYLKQSVLTVPWNKIYKRSIIEKFNIRFPLTKLEDHHFNMEYIKNISSCKIVDKAFYHYYRSRPGSELTAVSRFDLFKKKKEHYLHTKEVLDYWNCYDEKNLNILHSFFAERVIQCIQEIVANNSLNSNEKRNKIKYIFNDDVFNETIKRARCDSKTMRMLLIPIKYKLFFLTILECKFITYYKRKHEKKFILKKAFEVNKSKIK